MLECVVNVSEGEDAAMIGRLAGTCRSHLLDVHSDADHNRSVFTLGGGEGLFDAVRDLAREVVSSLDLSAHSGAHPRIGTLDVVPWVSLARAQPSGGVLVDGSQAPAMEARLRFAQWAGTELRLPCFVYGFEAPTLPEVRRRAWVELAPTTGPATPHPMAGGCAVGARPVLVAYNFWLAEDDLVAAGGLARELRSRYPGRVRTLALRVGSRVQLSCNLIDPWVAGPGAAFDFVASRTAVERCELVGLVPAAVLRAEPRHRWKELGLDPSTTIEARLEQAGLDGGRFDVQ